MPIELKTFKVNCPFCEKSVICAYVSTFMTYHFVRAKRTCPWCSEIFVTEDRCDGKFGVVTKVKKVDKNGK